MSFLVTSLSLTLIRTQAHNWLTPGCPLSGRAVLAARLQALRLAMFAGESVEQQRELLVAA
jgi:hypothetical protein